MTPASPTRTCGRATRASTSPCSSSTCATAGRCASTTWSPSTWWSTTSPGPPSRSGYLLTVEGQARATAVTVHGAVDARGRPSRMPAFLAGLVGPGAGEPVRVSYGLPTHRVDWGDEFLAPGAIGELARRPRTPGSAPSTPPTIRSPATTGWPTAATTPSTRWWPCPSPPRPPRRSCSTPTSSSLAYRNPFLAAKGIATLDVLSGGRTRRRPGRGLPRAGVRGAGGALRRAQRPDGRGAGGAGGGVVGGERHLRGARLPRPRATRCCRGPAQRPRPPLWIGGNSRRAIRRAVESADGWCPFPNPGQVARPGPAPPRCESAGRPGRRPRVRPRTMPSPVGRTEPLTVCFIPEGLSMGARPVDEARVVASIAGAGGHRGRTGSAWPCPATPGWQPRQRASPIDRLRPDSRAVRLGTLGPDARGESAGAPRRRRLALPPVRRRRPPGSWCWPSASPSCGPTGPVVPHLRRRVAAPDPPRRSGLPGPHHGPRLGQRRTDGRLLPRRGPGDRTGAPPRRPGRRPHRRGARWPAPSAAWPAPASSTPRSPTAVRGRRAGASRWPPTSPSPSAPWPCWAGGSRPACGCSCSPWPWPTTSARWWCSPSSTRRGPRRRRWSARPVVAVGPGGPAPDGPRLTTAVVLAGGVVLWVLLAAGGVEPALAGVVAGLLVPGPAVTASGRAEPAGRARAPGGPVVGLRRPAAVRRGQRRDHLPLAGSSAAAGCHRRLRRGRAGPGGRQARRASPWPACVVVRLGLGRLPDGVRWRHLAGGAAVAGIGFTVPLLIAELAFVHDPPLVPAAELGLFAGSARGLRRRGGHPGLGRTGRGPAPEPAAAGRTSDRRSRGDVAGRGAGSGG